MSFDLVKSLKFQIAELQAFNTKIMKQKEEMLRDIKTLSIEELREKYGAAAKPF